MDSDAHHGCLHQCSLLQGSERGTCRSLAPACPIRIREPGCCAQMPLQGSVEAATNQPLQMPYRGAKKLGWCGSCGDGRGSPTRRPFTASWQCTESWHAGEPARSLPEQETKPGWTAPCRLPRTFHAPCAQAAGVPQAGSPFGMGTVRNAAREQGRCVPPAPAGLPGA